jgi:hypothetical protein
MIDRGVLYIAFGDRAQEQLQVSLRSLQKFAPHLAVRVVSDREVFGAKTIIRPDVDAGARTYKTQMYSLSPFAQTLFLDVDTELRSSPQPGFNLLGYVDLVLGQDTNRNFATNHWPYLNPDEVKTTAAELGTDHHMYFNDGVVFFNRNPRVEAMMTAWHAEWQRWKMHDQMALLRAIHKNPVRIAPMRAPWNTHVSAQAVFVFHKHHMARRMGAPR